MPRSARDKTDRPSEAHDINYVPTTPGDWTDPDPESVGDALDKEAAKAVEDEVCLVAAGAEFDF